jgi:hypothetical protein
MRRVSEVLSWLCGTFAMLCLVAAMLLASTPAYSQGPLPSATCTGCVGSDVFDANGNVVANTNCGNAVLRNGSCQVNTIIFGWVPGDCIQPLNPPGALCTNCACIWFTNTCSCR